MDRQITTGELAANILRKKAFYGVHVIQSMFRRFDSTNLTSSPNTDDESDPNAIQPLILELKMQKNTSAHIRLIE